MNSIICLSPRKIFPERFNLFLGLFEERGEDVSQMSSERCEMREGAGICRWGVTMGRVDAERGEGRCESVFLVGQVIQSALDLGIGILEIRELGRG